MAPPTAAHWTRTSAKAQVDRKLNVCPGLEQPQGVRIRFMLSLTQPYICVVPLTIQERAQRVSSAVTRGMLLVDSAKISQKQCVNGKALSMAARKSALVCGAGGFVGSHLVRRLKDEGFWVRGADLKFPEYWETMADDFAIVDLREPANCRAIIDQRFDEVYQLAADMGGAGYIFTGEHDADVMHNSASINLNVLQTCKNRQIRRVFYSSSACMYPSHNQTDPSAPVTREDSAYPANPDSEYGWEKLFSERLYLAYNRNYDMQCRIGRYHNIFGPYGTWTGGKEKAPAAICRKVAEASSHGSIDIWGDGEQTRSFLYISECLEGSVRLLRSDFEGPVNIGSDEMVSINQLATMVMEVAGKPLEKRHIPGPLGVRGRNSDNDLIAEKLHWKPSQGLRAGIEQTYPWVEEQVTRSHGANTHRPFAHQPLDHHFGHAIS